MDAADMWASLPCDLLVEILRRVDSTAVIRCTGVCRPWRRTIIANASCLEPRPDCFNPNLLIGFFHRHWLNGRHHARLQYLPGPFENVLASNVASTTCTTADAALYDEPLSSRDGFLLLGGSAVGDLCLCNPLTGSCRFVPAAAFGVSKPCTYVLVTGHDDSPPPTDGVWILAVKKQGAGYFNGGMYYQIFSSDSGEWGPVRRLAMAVEDDRVRAYLCDGAKDVVVCRGSVVYWFVTLIADDAHRRAPRCVLAIDVLAKRTRIVELPEKYMVLDSCIDDCMLALATAEDGRLSLIFQLRGHQIEVWVVIGDGEWRLQRTIDVQDFLHHYCPKVGNVRLSGFCPRSGCLFGDMDERDLLIDVDRGSVRPSSRFGVGHVTKL